MNQQNDEKRIKIESFGRGEKKIMLFFSDEKGKRIIENFYEGALEANEKNLTFYNVNFRALSERVTVFFAHGAAEEAVYAAKTAEITALFEINTEKSGLSLFAGAENAERAEQIALIFSAVAKLKRERGGHKTAACRFARETGKIALLAGAGGKDFSLSRLYEALCIFPELVR